jgi:hypothetical protein
VDVQVVPTTATVAPNATTRLAAAVTGTANTAVTWTVVQASGGTVDSTGLYTAPATAGSYTVRATSVADSTAHGDAAVTVTAPPPPVTVTISPRTPSVTAGGAITFTATVANATNTAVTWSVTGTTCGTITSAGVYTAPAAAGTCHVVATSVADGTKAAVSTVTVTDKVLSVTTSPATVSLAPGGKQQFTATVTTTCGAFQAVASVP